MGAHHGGDLELDENLDFQRKQWRFERVGWGLFAVLLMVALIGLFGTGPISAATAGGNGITVDYQRFVRHQGQTDLTITIDARHAVDGQVELTIPGDYHNSLGIQSVSPEPVEVQGDGTNRVYVFALAEGAGSIEVGIDAVPRQMGSLDGEVIVGETTVEFFQFAYP